MNCQDDRYVMSILLDESADEADPGMASTQVNDLFLAPCGPPVGLVKWSRDLFCSCFPTGLAWQCADELPTPSAVG